MIKAKLLGAAIALAMFGLSPAKADLFAVDGIFPAFGNIPANTLSGTINITGGQITSADLVVPGFTSHFTHILFNELLFSGTWILSAYDDNQSYLGPNGADYLTFNFTLFPGPFLIDFRKGDLAGGSVTNSTYNPITTVTTTTYYGFALQGTVCPVAGCNTVSLSVPAPAVGGGLPGLVFASGGLLAWWRRRK